METEAIARWGELHSVAEVFRELNLFLRAAAQVQRHEITELQHVS